MTHAFDRPAQWGTYLLKNLLLALVCYPVARLGLLFALDASGVSLIWPLTGVSVAALLLFGRDLWAGIWLALFVNSLVNKTPFALAVGIASGSTFMPVFAAYVLTERARFDNTFRHVRDVLSFVTIGVIVSPIISAFVGTTCLFLSR